MSIGGNASRGPTHPHDTPTASLPAVAEQAAAVVAALEEDRKVLAVQSAAVAAWFEAAMVVSHVGWCRCGRGSKPASNALVSQLRSVY